MLSKQEFASFRKETEQALQELAKKYNVNIEAAGIKYTSNSFDMTLKMTKKEVNGKSFEQAEFEKHCILYGFKPEDYNKSFVMNGKTYTLCGFKLKARTMPVLARNKDGQNYKFGEDTVKRLLTA
jgi:hypothetical protein